MRSFRSKPVGWRGESYRHSLAAKGIYSASKSGQLDSEFFELVGRARELKRQKETAQILRKAAVKKDDSDYREQAVEYEQDFDKNFKKFQDESEHLRVWHPGSYKRLQDELAEEELFAKKQTSVGQVDRARVLLKKESEMMKKWKAGVEGSGLTEEEMYELQSIQSEVNGIMTKLNQAQRDVLRAELDDPYMAVKSDFVQSGGQTYLKMDDGKMVNIEDPRDIKTDDDEALLQAQQEMSMLSNMGVIPWEAQGAVFSAASQPQPMYARKKKKMEKVHGVPIKVGKMEEGRVFPITPERVKALLKEMPKEHVKGIKAVEFVDPKGDQEHAWAQYVRGSKVVKIFSQPSDGGLVDGQCPRSVARHIEEYVIPHEVGHHRALRGGKTDRNLAVAEARADANVVGLDPFDKDVKALVKS